MTALGRMTSPAVLGAGPVGRAVVATLSDAGHAPRVVTRSGTIVPGARSVAADLSNPTETAAAIDGASVVFQCAQPAYHRWAEEFPALQSSILDACAQNGAALIATENTYGYGETSGPMTPDLPMRPCSIKGRVRAEMWAELEAAHETGRIQTAAVRASDFFGPGVDGSAFGSRFFDAIRDGKKAEVMLSGDTFHSVTYVDDLARALVAVGGDPTSWGRAWHAPTAPAVTQRELVALAAQAAGTGSTARVVPLWQMRMVGLFMKELKEMVELAYEFTDDHILDSSEFEHRFGIAPTPLNISLAQTIHNDQEH